MAEQNEELNIKLFGVTHGQGIIDKQFISAETDPKNGCVIIKYNLVRNAKIEDEITEQIEEKLMHYPIAVRVSKDNQADLALHLAPEDIEKIKTNLGWLV